MFGSNVWGTVFGRLCRVPVIVAHEHSWSYVGQPLRRLLDRELISRFANAFVAVSAADRDRMIAIERVRPAKIRVVPTAYIPRAADGNGDIRRELGIPADDPVIGTVAVLRPEKALEVLLAAFSMLPERLSRARLIIAGEGWSRPPLMDEAARLGVQDRVHFLGMRADTDAVWRALDVAAISSDREGFPVAALEAMTNGVPLVATAVGGVPELLEDGVSALLLPPRNPEALAQALVRLLDDPALRATLADEAKRVSRAFSLERLLSTMDEMYVGLLGQSRRGRATLSVVNATTTR
jgi:glycosyltransferase involved in cell wall biosynthesis